MNPQFNYVDVYDENREFGPVFNATHFLLPVLKLQKSVEAIVAEDGTTFQDVCNAPLSPQSKICNVQSIWAYWQVSDRSCGFNEVYTPSLPLEVLITCKFPVLMG